MTPQEVVAELRRDSQIGSRNDEFAFFREGVGKSERFTVHECWLDLHGWNNEIALKDATKEEFMKFLDERCHDSAGGGFYKVYPQPEGV